MDDLSSPWKDHFPYMFPPLSLIMSSLEKIRSEQATAILIALMWQSQLWYLSLLRFLVDLSIMLPPVQDILLNPDGQSHPLVGQGHLHLAAWLISGDPSTQRDSFRDSIESAYSSAWQPWDSWCLGQGVNSLSAPLKEISSSR